jgi:uncharacterized protein YbjQ (UPF0145 family)
MIITTTSSVESRSVDQYLGVVAARSTSPEGALSGGMSALLEELATQARGLGADAIIGLDVNFETVGDGTLVVSAVGTAVDLAYDL